MKKLFSTLLMLLVVFTLSACTDETSTYKLQIAELQELVDELNAEKADNLPEIERLEEEILELQEDLDELQAMIFDSVLNVSLKDEKGNVELYPIGYNDDYTGTLIDLVYSEIAIEYTDSGFGNYITSVGGMDTQMGNYVKMTLNGQMTSVGIDDLAYFDQDVLGFEISWWDEELHSLDTAIDLFLENQAANYVNDESVDYNVALALNILGIADDFVSEDEVLALYPENKVYSSTRDYFKGIMALETFGLDSSGLMEELTSLASVGIYGKTAYDLIGLNAYSHNGDYSSFEASAIADLTTINTPLTLGLDSGGMALVALSNYKEVANVQTVVDEYLSWVSTDQLATGGILTVDNGWGSSENAASISSVIIGMVSYGENPAGTDYTKDGNNLVSRLIDFQNDDGGFKYLIADDASDLMFSTPQAFLALVMYQEYKHQFDVAINAYNFN